MGTRRLVTVTDPKFKIIQISTGWLNFSPKFSVSLYGLATENML